MSRRRSGHGGFDFVNLFIARRFLAPDAPALCLDAELPLPFSDKSMDAVFCLDGFHYVRSKIALLRELDRVISEDGAWVFAHLHNAAGINVNPGAPLDARGYMQRFVFGQRRLLPETQIIRWFQHQGCLDLTEQLSEEVLDASAALTLMGARSDRLWVRHFGLDQALSRRPDLLAINPVYRVEEDGNGLLARAVWPSDSLRQECVGILPLIRETVQLNSQTVQDLAALAHGELLSAGICELLRTFAIVPLPECYHRAAFDPTRTNRQKRPVSRYSISASPEPRHQLSAAPYAKTTN
jgi:SAM-dependent methyltransferase